VVGGARKKINETLFHDNKKSVNDTAIFEKIDFDKSKFIAMQKMPTFREAVTFPKERKKRKRGEKRRKRKEKERTCTVARYTHPFDNQSNQLGWTAI
jgi:hypothetical protein